jgi:type III secretion protein R
VLGLVPFFAVLATSYTKIVIVFGLIRLALGTQQVPPNLVINAMAIVLTCFVMAPLGNEMGKVAAQKLDRQEQRFDDLVKAAQSASEPMRRFLDKHAGDREKRLFLKTAQQVWPADYVQQTQPDDLLILLPAFTLSEVAQAFLIGFVLSLAFVVVDLLVSAVLLAMGMSMVAPMTISLPFKLLLFVALDGWSRLVQSLLVAYK